MTTQTVRKTVRRFARGIARAAAEYHLVPLADPIVRRQLRRDLLRLRTAAVG